MDATSARVILASDLTLSVRARKAINKLGCRTLGDIADKDEKEFYMLPRCGDTTIREIKRLLREHGLSFKSITGEIPMERNAPETTPEGLSPEEKDKLLCMLFSLIMRRLKKENPTLGFLKLLDLLGQETGFSPETLRNEVWRLIDWAFTKPR
jgi:hypothetical protein